MPRRALAVLFLLSLLSLALPARAADEEWEFEGGGSGYGVGLSKYGALGQALDGRSATQILQYYYTGTYLAPIEPSYHWILQPQAVPVGLVDNVTSIDLGAIGGPITVCQPEATCPPSGSTEPSTFSDFAINPGETWRFEANGSDTTQCRFRKVSPEPAGSLGWGPCSGRLTKSNATSVRFVLNGEQYARGEIEFSAAPAGFDTVVILSLEHYLYGLDVVPSTWPGEAQRALAIVIRSTAVLETVRVVGGGGDLPFPERCGCYVLEEYVGWRKEDPAKGGNAWVAAVNATRGMILVHPSAGGQAFSIAPPVYSLSNGGRSENVEDVWGGEPLPWLRSVADPWSADRSINPDARWKVVVRSSDLAHYLGWKEVTSVDLLEDPPGAVIFIRGRGERFRLTKEMFPAEIKDFLDAYGFRRDGEPVHASPFVIDIWLTSPFKDTAGVFEGAIAWMAARGFAVGCNPPTNDMYCPQDHVTRGEMAVFISRVLSLPNPTVDHFADDDGRFYESAANRLFEAGITVGCGTKHYCGDLPIPRGEVAAFLARTLNLPMSSTDHFVDDEGSIFEGAINKIADAQLTVGCNPPDNDRFCPEDYVTRGQMAAFFKRAWGG